MLWSALLVAGEGTRDQWSVEEKRFTSCLVLSSGGSLGGGCQTFFSARNPTSAKLWLPQSFGAKPPTRPASLSLVLSGKNQMSVPRPMRLTRNDSTGSRSIFSLLQPGADHGSLARE
jgi:hypothetical protein